jgi:hypothetical protein
MRIPTPQLSRLNRIVFLVVLFSGLFCQQMAKGAQCTYVLAPTSSSIPSAGTNSNFSVTAGPTCNWTAATTNLWINTTNTGTGNGSIAYNVDPNLLNSPRTGAITAGGQTFTLTQAGAPLPLGLALENTNLIWTTSPTYPWFGTNPPAPAYDGVNSAVSGNRFVPNSVSWLQTTVVGPGQVSFWWKVDSDVTPPPPDPADSFDFLNF